MLRLLRHRSLITGETEALVRLICEAFPLAEQRRLTDARLKKQSAASVRKIAQAARALALRHSAGIVIKAYVANQVRWALSERGYGAEFVEAVIASLVVSMQE
jgi:hypothetical protein